MALIQQGRAFQFTFGERLCGQKRPWRSLNFFRTFRSLPATRYAPVPVIAQQVAPASHPLRNWGSKRVTGGKAKTLVFSGSLYRHHARMRGPRQGFFMVPPLVKKVIRMRSPCMSASCIVFSSRSIKPFGSSCHTMSHRNCLIALNPRSSARASSRSTTSGWK